MRRGDLIGKRRLTRAATAVLGALSMWLVLVPPAEASWTPTDKVSPAGWMGQDSPKVAVDRQGDSLLVWAACKTGTSGCLFQVQAGLKPRRGPMGQVKTLSPLGPVASWPQVASDDNGDSAVVWEQDRPSRARGPAFRRWPCRPNRLEPVGTLLRNLAAELLALPDPRALRSMTTG
jgi:hypothetical protein